jgi:BarA-like signal transduction histidine kinase
MLFWESTQWLVEETNQYHQYLDTMVKQPQPLSDMTILGIHLLFVNNVQMGHDQGDTMHDY